MNNYSTNSMPQSKPHPSDGSNEPQSEGERELIEFISMDLDPAIQLDPNVDCVIEL